LALGTLYKRVVVIGSVLVIGLLGFLVYLACTKT
jgi:preprotein translocase subunit Sss1